jgi:hypothetical protein
LRSNKGSPHYAVIPSTQVKFRPTSTLSSHQAPLKIQHVIGLVISPIYPHLFPSYPTTFAPTQHLTRRPPNSTFAALTNHDLRPTIHDLRPYAFAISVPFSLHNALSFMLFAYAYGECFEWEAHSSQCSNASIFLIFCFLRIAIIFLIYFPIPQFNSQLDVYHPIILRRSSRSACKSSVVVKLPLPMSHRYVRVLCIEGDHDREELFTLFESREFYIKVFVEFHHLHRTVAYLETCNSERNRTMWRELRHRRTT